LVEISNIQSVALPFDYRNSEKTAQKAKYFSDYFEQKYAA